MFDQPVFGFAAQRGAVAQVEPIQLVPHAVGRALHGLGVRRRQPRRVAQQVRRIDRQRRQALDQIEGLAIVAQHGDRHQPPHAQGGQVVHHRPQRSRIVADARDLIGFEPGLDRQLAQLRIEVQVAIEEQVAQQADGPILEPGEERFEALERDHD